MNPLRNAQWREDMIPADCHRACLGLSDQATIKFRIRIQPCRGLSPISGKRGGAIYIGSQSTVACFFRSNISLGHFTTYSPAVRQHRLPMTLDLKSTFTPPLLDGSRDLLQIITHNAQHNAPYPLFRYASANGAVETITWGGATKAFDVAARFVLDSATFKVEDAGAPPVVAILANLGRSKFARS
jgi:hypothetical protein